MSNVPGESRKNKKIQELSNWVRDPLKFIDLIGARASVLHSGGAICFTNGIIGMERIDGFLWWNLSPWSERDYGCGILPGAFIFFSNTEENNSEWIVKQLWIRNNKTNIKFWFRIIWKIMQTLMVVKLCEAISIGFLYWWITTILNLHNFSYHTSPHSQELLQQHGSPLLIIFALLQVT